MATVTRLVRPSDLFDARALIAARRARKSARAKNLAPPDSAALSYDRDLTRMFKAFQAEALSALEPEIQRLAAPEGSGVWSPEDRPDAMIGIRVDAILPAAMERVLRDLDRLIDDFLNRFGINGVLDDQFNKVNRFAIRELGRSLGIDISASGLGLGDVIDEFRTGNVILIRRALAGSLQDLADTLAENQGERVETIRDLVQERFGVSRSRAALIARDQTLKLNAQVTQRRQTALGITRYKWVTSNDAAVRPDHVKLNQGTFEWINPPVVDTRTGRRAHPGEDFQCRCTATPILDNVFPEV